MFALQTIDGTAPPAVAPNNGDQVISEVLTLSGNGFALATVMRMVADSVLTGTNNLYHAGRLTMSGSDMIFQHTPTGWDFDV